MVTDIKTWQKTKLEDNSKEISQKLEKKYRVIENMKEHQEERLSAGGSTFDK